MKKRGLPILVALCMLLSIIATHVFAAENNVKLSHIPDTSQTYSSFTEGFGKVFALDDDTDSEQVFDYHVPADGMTVLIFFAVSNGNSTSLFRGLNSSENDVWTRSSEINIVAIESSGADKAAVKEFMEKYDTESLVDHVFYHPGNSKIAQWYTTLAENHGDMSGVTELGTESAAYSYVLLITEESGTNYIRYTNSSISLGASLLDYIDACINASVTPPVEESSAPTVDVIVSGNRRYDCAREVVDLVNQERSIRGLSPLTMGHGMTEVAMQRAAELAVHIAHERPDGKSFATAVSTNFNENIIVYAVSNDMNLAACENLSVGPESPADVMDAWMNSETHRSNILTSSYQQIGVGCFENNGILYWIQWFSPRTTSQISTQTGSIPTDVGVKTLMDHLDLMVDPDAIELDVDAFVVTAPLHNRRFLATLRPILPEIKDAHGNVIATASCGDAGSGTIRLQGVSAGTATIRLAAYEGQRDGPTIQVTVNASHVNHSVDVIPTSHGSLSVSCASASAGTKVTITVSPNDGYEVDGVIVTGAGGAPVDAEKISEHRYIFEMPTEPVTVEASFLKSVDPEPEPAPSFADVPSSAWYYDAVAFVCENGIMEGTGDTQFQPAMTTTRAMIVTMLHRLEGEPFGGTSSFHDIVYGSWYADAVAWASSPLINIVEGYDNGGFGPNDAITREQLATFLYRYAQYKGYDTASTGSLSGYSDAGRVSSWARTAISWANTKGLVTGNTATTLNPLGYASRAEVATVLMRFVENVAESSSH